MSTRMTLLALAGTLACGAAATPTFAGDFAISFSFSSSGWRCYTPYVPRDYRAYYGYDYRGPLRYLTCSTPRTVVYDTCYPTTYRTTYSRSYYYPRPPRHSRTTVCYRSGQRSQHYRSHASYRHHYRKPRMSSRTRCYRSSPRYRHDYRKPSVTIRTYDRGGRSYCRPSRSHYRYLSPHKRVRIYRR